MISRALHIARNISEMTDFENFRKQLGKFAGLKPEPEFNVPWETPLSYVSTLWNDFILQSDKLEGIWISAWAW